MASVICVGCMLVVWQSVVCGECNLCWVHACCGRVLCGEYHLCCVHAYSVAECVYVQDCVSV